jgi:hypothetical protein
MSRTASASSIVPVVAAGLLLNVFGGLTHPARDTARPASPPAKVAAAGNTTPAGSAPAR